MASKSVRFSDQIRAAVKSSGLSMYSISKATGIAESMLSRFVRGERGLMLDTLDVLAAHIGIEAVLTRKPTSTKGKK